MLIPGRLFVFTHLIRNVMLVPRKNSGTEVKLDAEEHRIVGAEDILEVVEE